MTICASPADKAFVPVCAQHPDLWFPGNRRVSRTFMEWCADVCSACPLRQSCARSALDTPGVIGIWAGVLVPVSPGATRDAALQRLQMEAGCGPQRGGPGCTGVPGVDA